jgi:methionyl-tRNA formyltransferase
MSPYQIVIASSTARGTKCAQSLFNSPLFEIAAVLTPQPRPIGRHQILTLNPLHNFATQNNLPTLLIDKKLTEQQTALSNLAFDFLLVVDFGYFIPNWLLTLPKIAPVNIHPSALPKYRGASPGQFTLLFGDQTSAVSLIIVSDKMDRGDVIAQLPFAVNANWNADAYYQFAFDLISPQLPTLLDNFATHKITATPQEITSPTPLARQLGKNDAFVNWQTVTYSANISEPKNNLDVSVQYIKSCENDILTYKNNHKQSEYNTESNEPAPLLTALLADTPPTTHAAILERACRAFSPWPHLWTIYHGKRLQIISCHLNEKTGALVLDKVKIEGKSEQNFSDIIRL